MNVVSKDNNPWVINESFSNKKVKGGNNTSIGKANKESFNHIRLSKGHTIKPLAQYPEAM